jgi:hypothetical protein
MSSSIRLRAISHARMRMRFSRNRTKRKAAGSQRRSSCPSRSTRASVISTCAAWGPTASTIRLPNEIVLDKKAGKGTFEVEHDTPGYEDFTLDSSGLDSLPGDGVFTLHIELADGQVVDQWFIVHGLAASTSPDVQSPVSAQTFSDTNPQVRWIPYQSPEYRPFERRHLGIWLSNEADDTWGFYSGHGGELGSVTIGDHPGVEKKRLAPGEYWVAVDGHELRSFGALRLVRTGRRLVSFHVVR